MKRLSPNQIVVRDFNKRLLAVHLGGFKFRNFKLIRPALRKFDSQKGAKMMTDKPAEEKDQMDALTTRTTETICQVIELRTKAQELLVESTKDIFR